jgi:hypothetical protein
MALPAEIPYHFFLRRFFMTLRLSKSFFIAALALVVVAGLLPVPSQALTFYSSRGAFPGNDYVDWSGFGVNSTPVPSGSAISSNLGLSMTVANANSSSLERRDQGSGWSGNFAPGDALIWTRGSNGPLEITFASPIFGAGAQIQQNQFGAFTGYIEAFDATNTSLGSFTLPGNSTAAGDNSAIFMGVFDSLGSIKRLIFNVNTTDLAINRMDLAGVAVPLPGSLLLLGSSLLGLVGLRLKKS